MRGCSRRSTTNKRAQGWAAIVKKIIEDHAAASRSRVQAAWFFSEHRRAQTHQAGRRAMAGVNPGQDTSHHFVKVSASRHFAVATSVLYSDAVAAKPGGRTDISKSW